MRKQIIAVVGCPGSGKTFACEGAQHLYDYVPHDSYISRGSNENEYVGAILATAAQSDRPVLIEVPFSMTAVIDPLEQEGHEVVCLFVQEEPEVIAARYEAREGRPIPKGHLSRQRTYRERAELTGSFMGTSEEVLAELIQLAGR